MTDEAKKKLCILKLAHEMKRVAICVGSLHPWWDVIFDMDAFVKRKPTIVQKTADEWIAYAENLIKEHHERSTRR